MRIDYVSSTWRPVSRTQRATWLREVKPSFMRMFSTCLGCALSDEQALTDLAIGHPLGHQSRHLTLPRRENRPLGRLRILLPSGILRLGLAPSVPVPAVSAL